MNQPNEYSPAERDRLEQELLELHFGCHEDPGALQARLAAEPALRALQQEVLRKAQLLEEAARPEQPALDLKLPASGAESKRPKWPWRVLRSPVGRILAAASLAAVTVLGAFVAERIASWRLAAHRAERLHVTVSAPQAVPVGAPWSFTVQANDLDGRPTACRVRWQAFGQRDAVLAANEVALNDGKTTVAMPATDQVPQRLEVVATHATDEVQQVLPLLAGVAGPLVHVTTDRPVYRPGEPVFARAVVLDRVTLQPLSLPSATAMQARLLDPKGAQVAIAGNMPSAGAGGFWLAIPPTSAGGEHRLEVSSPDGSFAPESIALVVRPFQNPQLKKTIVLDRATYAPGARGSAAVTAERMGGGMAAGAAVRGALVLDGSEVWNETQPLDGEGKVQFRFAVPAEVKGGSARFVATITDGGIVETEVRPFVVPTGRVLVAAFPEGGDLVAGVENQVYLECTDPLGRYVDTSGVVVDDRGEVLAKFRSTHQGRVKLAFVPRAGRSYSVHLAGKPAAEAQALPAVAQTGIAMQLLGDEVEANAPLRLQLAGRGDGPWLLGVFCRGALVGQEALRADSGGELRAVAEVPLPASAAGVLRATLFDRKMQPVAERLLRRASAQRVQVELACAHEALTPGDSQQVTVRTRDEAGQPLAAMVGLSVTDLAAASMGSEPRIGLADHASLFADVERTENLGDFLLGNPEGARNADLLLGTRGWRKFVWRNDAPAQAAIAAHGPFAANLLAREGVARPPQAVSNLQAANAAGAVLREARWHSEQLLSNVLRGVLVVLLVWVLVEVLIANVRRARRGSPLPLLATAGTIVAAAAFMVTTTMMVGESKHAVPAAMARDFEVEVARGAAVHYAISGANVEEPVGADDWFLHANAAKVDPAANPLAGAFFNVGVDGDIRARAENFFLEPGDKAALEAARDELNAANFAKARIGPSIVRVYAHQHKATDNRADFAPTIYWNPQLQTNAQGEASASFDTSDAVTTWLVQADAHALAGSGRVGQAETKFTARLPFHLECKLPDELSAGDTLSLPVAAIVEGSTIPAVDLRVQLGGGLRLSGEVPQRIDLVNGRGRALVPVAAEQGATTATLSIEGRAGRFTDRVSHTLRIVPRGFQHKRSAGGTVAAGTPAELALAIPQDAVPGSGRVTLKLFPSPLAALTEGLQGILQEPHGCFEQASSSNYPNTLVLALLEASGDNVPTVAARARALLPRGYAKITGYECKERGYEWFGGDPGHEALTAYGLLQFHDMAKVHPVDAAMVERTRTWLLGRRDGKGGYQRNSRALDSFGRAPQPVTDAYVTYALLVGGVTATELQKELDALLARAPATEDPYELALIACALQLAQRNEPAAAARTRLAGMQQENGSLRGTTSSITSSGGQDLIVESTGFAVLAWLPDPACQGQLRRAVQFLQGARGASGTFGATQATIVALRALTEYAQANRAMKAPGTLRVFAGERLLLEKGFAAGAVDALALELWNLLPPGAHALRLELEGGGGTLPWACDVAYHSEQPADDPAAKVALRASLRAGSVREGETVALDVEVENRTAEGLPMTMAIVGLPAGLELPTRVLEDLQKAQRFAFWELRGRELALYWRDFEPEGKRTLTLDLMARVPGRSTGPASRGYLYYTPAAKRWAVPVAVEVSPR